MAWQLRRTTTFGPIRLTLTRRGVGASIGFGPLRWSLGPDGKVRRTVRVPGTGVYRTDVVRRDRRGDDPR